MNNADWKNIREAYELIKKGTKRVDSKNFIMYDMHNGTIRIDIREVNDAKEKNR